MHFGFDDDQLAMRDAMRSFCADRFDLTAVAAREGMAADPSTWAGLADLGVLGMRQPGSGIGPVEAAIVFEELGASLASGPMLWTVLAGPFVDGVADGAVRVTGAEVDGDGPVPVEHLDESDVVLLLRDDRLERVEVAASRPGSPLDPLTPVGILDRRSAGTIVAEGAAVTDLRRWGEVLAAAMLVGGAQGALDVARAYALERQQFGVPIGSFQAVKHLLADMYVRVELARASTYAAAAVLADPGAGDPERSAGAAKLLAGEAANANGRAAVQILGGMGFTWDMLPHYFLKRAWVLDSAFGTAPAHAARLGAAVGEEVGA